MYRISTSYVQKIRKIRICYKKHKTSKLTQENRPHDIKPFFKGLQQVLIPLSQADSKSQEVCKKKKKKNTQP